MQKVVPVNRNRIWACLLIFTKVFTCRAHVQDRYFTEIATRFQCGQDCPSVVGHHLQTTSVHYVHFLSHFACKQISII